MQSLSIKNRNESYVNLLEKLPKKRQLIYQLISETPGITAQQISIKHFLPINEITGRITELKEMCLIEEWGESENQHSGQANTGYRAIKNRSEIINRINLKYAEIMGIKDALVSDYHNGLSVYTRNMIVKEIKKQDKRIAVLENTLKNMT